MSRWWRTLVAVDIEPTIPEIVSAFQRIERGLYRESFTATNTPDSISLDSTHLNSIKLLWAWFNEAYIILHWYLCIRSR